MKYPKETVVIEYPFPMIDGGRYAVKREEGQIFDVFADVYKDGHDAAVAQIKYRHEGDKTWKKAIMNPVGDHRFKGSFPLEKLGRYQYTVIGFPENQPELITEYPQTLEVVVDRIQSRYSTWYEMWPRSQGTEEGVSATFQDMKNRLPEIKAMGFDVVYLTPIHPIGETKKKGPNNSLEAGPEDPGCPYSIGNKHGGHKAVEPTLGTIDDFEDFIKACHGLKMEVALDIVHTCSPDHPYIKEHPEWFLYNEDGSLKFAENPPKKYEDVIPLNFYPENYMEMWDEMTSIFSFWVQKGVKIFRVDNPHTKPVAFWEYCISKVKAEAPETIFLSEAFTHPKMMKILAKVGFTQSYTYFTWRNTKHELSTYLNELAHSEMAEYYRPNFFANTPDILPFYLQTGGRNAFKIRLALAATLSPCYGIYNGFELCENTPIPGKEEYLNSEKYQFKVWDWNRPGHIKAYVRAFNKIRKKNPALQYLKNIHFLSSQNDQVLAFVKNTPDNTNIILVVVNLDPYQTQESNIEVPNHMWGIGNDENYTVTDLLTGQTFIWRGNKNYVKLNPHIEPVHVFKISRWEHYDADFPSI